jgi:hypothetical protein
VKILIRTSLVLLTLLAISNGQTKQPAPYTPPKDLKGNWTVPVDPKLPNVLILGDSISIGYTRSVRKLLSDKANVFRPMAQGGKSPDNCGDTIIGLKNIDGWLGETRWDLIHFNWGLWDLCYRNPAVKTQGNRDKINGKLSVSPEDYEHNLEELVKRLKATGATLIWASTSAVPEGEAGRIVGDDVKYNAIAKRVMAKNEIPTDDLHALTSGFAGKFSTGAGDVHFTAAGYDRIAKHVAEEIAGALAKQHP